MNLCQFTQLPIYQQLLEQLKQNNAEKYLSPVLHYSALLKLCFPEQQQKLLWIQPTYLEAGKELIWDTPQITM